MKNGEKLQVFLEIAEKLNAEMDSTPILYGSLGLSEAINKDIKTDDIDMLVEHRIFSTQLGKIRSTMAELGFELTDPEENCFQRDDIKVGIATDGDMITFSGINPQTLCIKKEKATYRVLNAEQYLATYKASSLDGYRKNKHQKDDQAKIELIITKTDKE